MGGRGADRRAARLRHRRSEEPVGHGDGHAPGDPGQLVAGGEMSDSERALRRVLPGQPPKDDQVLVELVLARIGRRRRATLAGIAGGGAAAVAGAVAVVVLLATGGALGGGMSAASPGGPVPWTDRTAPVYTPPPQPTPTAPSAEYAACTASSLTGKPGDVSMGAGQITQYIVLTNAGVAEWQISGAH